eukprot:gene25212-biopygen16482
MGNDGENDQPRRRWRGNVGKTTESDGKVPKGWWGEILVLRRSPAVHRAPPQWGEERRRTRIGRVPHDAKKQTRTGRGPYAGNVVPPCHMCKQREAKREATRRTRSASPHGSGVVD